MVLPSFCGWFVGIKIVILLEAMLRPVRLFSSLDSQAGLS
jgi:hypothetical protein